MRNPRDRRPPTLGLDNHSEVPGGQSIQSTTASEVERAAIPFLKPISRPVVPNPSPEPSTSSVPELDSDDSTVSSATDCIPTKPLRNAFAARPERLRRNRTLLLAPVEDIGLAHSTGSPLSPLASGTTPVSAGTTRDEDRELAIFTELSDLDADQSAHILSSPIATRTHLLSSPNFLRNANVLAAPPVDLRATTNQTFILARPAFAINSDQHQLPPRPEPAAESTLDRFLRSGRRVFRRGAAVHDEGFEMNTFSHSAASHPDFFVGGLAEVIQDQELQRQQGDDDLQIQAQQVRISWWQWMGFSVLGAGTFVVIYGAVTGLGR